MATTIGNPLRFNEPDPATLIADGYNQLRVYTASSYGGSYTLLTTITLAADTFTYSYDDTAGLATSWYYSVPFNSTTTNEGAAREKFPAQPALAITRINLRRLAANALGLFFRPLGDHDWPGPSGTTTAAGSTTTIVCDAYADSELANGTSGASTVLRGYVASVVTGNAAGQDRRVSTLDETTGTLTVSRAYTTTPGSGVDFDLYGAGLTAAHWDGFLEEARLDVWTPFEIAISGVASETEYALPYWIESEEQVSPVLEYRSGTTLRQHRISLGRQVELRPQYGGGYVLYASGGLSATDVYILSGMRHLPPFAADTDTVILAEPYQRLLYLTTALRAAKWLAQSPQGYSDNTKRWVDLTEQMRQEVAGLNNELNTWPEDHVTDRNPLEPVDGGGGGRAFGRFSQYTG